MADFTRRSLAALQAWLDENFPQTSRPFSDVADRDGAAAMEAMVVPEFRAASDAADIVHI